MKKILFAAMAVVMLCACKGEREYLDFRGLSLGMSAKAMCDSLVAQGFVVDTTLSDEQAFVLTNAKDLSRVDIHQNNDTIIDVLESYAATYNDSTIAIYESKHKEFTDLYGWSNMKHNADLHKEAVFQTNGKGGLTLILHNTYSPTVSILYSVDEK
jgi:hypothetical protein